MPRWKALSDELDPQVREFAGQLRRLVDRRGLSIAAVADRTGYSKTSWERYLSGRLLAPRGAIVALAEATGTSQVHLTTMWELAERAWSRSEMGQDMTTEPLRISRASASLPPAPQQPPHRTGGGEADRCGGSRRRLAVLLAGAVGVLFVLAGAVLLAGAGR
ncbi:helix-turn-helix domain-containing protein [Streptomyces sp. NPDC057557]|uniref:helix-turn-helix domain-containing protein n=1 Tax=Streptomyces sp. NPDC057557 TaxID=3346167 RepID=UPI00369D2A28